MRVFQTIWGCTLGVMLLLGLCQPTLAQSSDQAVKSKLSLCYERADIRPWRRTDDTGLNFDLLRMAAQRTGVGVEFVNLPWKRCLSYLHENRVDGVFAASFHEERLAIGVYPGGVKPDSNKRLHLDRYVLVRRKGDAVHWDGHRMSGLTGAVGTQLGYSIGKRLKEQGLDVDDASQTAPELLKKLQAGRLGAAALGGSDASILLNPNSAEAHVFEVLPIPLEEKPYFLMLSHQLVREHSQLADRFWSGIAQARVSPEYRKLELLTHQGKQP